MPKAPTFPTLFDECKAISIGDLRKLRYLKPSQCMSGNLIWKRNGVETGSITIYLNFWTEDPNMVLSYRCNGVDVSYVVQMVSVPANIGKGVVWYFICPRTGVRCRKLHFVDGYFYHRSAFRGCMYEKQTYSRSDRSLCKQFDEAFAPDHFYDQVYARYFKKTYASRPTKRYRRLLKKLVE